MFNCDSNPSFYKQYNILPKENQDLNGKIKYLKKSFGRNIKFVSLTKEFISYFIFPFSLISIEKSVLIIFKHFNTRIVVNSEAAYNCFTNSLSKDFSILNNKKWKMQY